MKIHDDPIVAKLTRTRDELNVAIAALTETPPTPPPAPNPKPPKPPSTDPDDAPPKKRGRPRKHPVAIAWANRSQAERDAITAKRLETRRRNRHSKNRRTMTA